MVYIGNNGKAASVSSIKVGDADGKAQNVVGGWAGDENGKARRIWSLDRPMWKFTCQNGVNLHVSGSGLAIDYGDGSGENIGTQTSEYHISHAYADAEPHQVTLYGVLTALQFWDDDAESAKNYLLSVDTPFPKNRIANVIGMFDNCTSLTSIPAGLFDNCPNVTDFSSTFYNCTSLTTIPVGLFDNCTAVTWFSNTFLGCTSLAAIPAGLFDNCPNVTNFAATFLDCTAITSAVPELWDTAKWPNVTSHDRCFRNCTNAANYADIPADWK